MVKSRRTKRAVTEVVRNPVSVGNGVVAEQAAGDLAMGGVGKSFVESAQGEDEAIAPRRREGGAMGLGSCGLDSTWSSAPIISTPLKPMYDQFASASKFVEPDRTLNLDSYVGCNYAIWASTPRFSEPRSGRRKKASMCTYMTAMSGSLTTCFAKSC